MDTDGIKQEISQGKTINEILIHKQHGSFYRHLRFFIAIMSFEDAIDCAASLYGFENRMKKKLIKSSVYPICIIVFAYGMLWFFASTIIPQMMDTFAQDASFATLAFWVACIRIGCIMFAILSILGIGCLWYIYLHKELFVALWKKGHHYRLIRDYESYLFSGYLKEMDHHGISTRKAMELLQKIRKDCVFYHVVHAIEQQLAKGEDFTTALQVDGWLNDNLLIALRIASATNQVGGVLTTFMQQMEQQWEHTLKKASVCIQCIAYVFVGFVVLIVYQIMLIPLGMLEQM